MHHSSYMPSASGGSLTKTCIAYLRVSTTMQVNEGISLETQQRAIQEWALRHGYVVRAEERDEGLSGSSTKGRVALQRAMDAIREGEALVVYSLSRLARSLVDTLNIVGRLKKRKADLVSATEPIDTVSVGGQLTMNILATFAQFESQIIAERVKACMREKKLRGEWVGQPPIGWHMRTPGEQGSGLVEDEAEQKVIRLVKILRERVDEHGRQYSYQRVIDELIRRNIPPPRASKRWYPMQVQRMCKQAPVTNTAGRQHRKQPRAAPAIEREPADAPGTD
jgi:DNA invertase Pin-like site-specific DNA recombinase